MASCGSLERIADYDVARGDLGALDLSVNGLLEGLKQLILSMGNTLDTIAHDLRTPLSRIMLATETALTRQAQDTELKRQMQNSLSDCAESALQANNMLTTVMKIND